MSVVERLAELGGVATRATLVRLTSRAELDRAVLGGDVVRVARGKLALPQADEGLRAAHALSGVLSHTSAALHWGWELKTVPERPHVTVPEKRRVAPERRAGVFLHRCDLHADDVDGIVTTRETTLLQSMRMLPFDEGLALPTLPCATTSRRAPCDASLRACADRAPQGSGGSARKRPRRRPTRSSRSCAPSPSTCQGCACGHSCGSRRRCGPFAWHGDRAALRRDAKRYNLMVLDGWIVLRFAWEDVMHEAKYVSRVLHSVVSLAQRQGQVACSRCSAA
jgi:hypothetical protein